MTDLTAVTGETLPQLPQSDELVTPDVAEMFERRVAAQIATFTDIDELTEQRDRADALATYLRGRDGHANMLGALRRMEARIGELLGPDNLKGGRGQKRQHADGIHRQVAKDFRSLAALVDRGLLDYAMDGDESPWQATRRALLMYENWLSLGGIKKSTSVEWYTPAKYIEAAREVMGGIDLDPASSPMANETVQATEYYTIDDDGLSLDWAGRIWCNPPYGKGTGLFASKLVEEYEVGRVTAAVFLINAYGFDTQWFEPLWAHPICFTDHRVEFTSPQRKAGGAANGNVFIYLGKEPARFAEVFRRFGHIVKAWP